MFLQPITFYIYSLFWFSLIVLFLSLNINKNFSGNSNDITQNLNKLKRAKLVLPITEFYWNHTNKLDPFFSSTIHPLQQSFLFFHLSCLFSFSYFDISTSFPPN